MVIVELFLFIGEMICGLFGGNGKPAAEESEPEPHPE